MNFWNDFSMLYMKIMLRMKLTEMDGVHSFIYSAKL